MTAASRPESARADKRSDRGIHLSPVWVAPLAALALVAYLLYTVLSQRGPHITVTFETADGLAEGVTNIRYKAVTLGTVEDIELSEDHSHVVVGVRMTNRAESMLTDSARFWVVRPRLGDGLGAFKTGLETLVSGAYVAIDPGAEPGRPQMHFEGLEKPPSIRSDEPGTTYRLQAEPLGGLSVGAPVFYRDVEVGEVLSYQLDANRRSVQLRIFVRAPYDRQVLSSTRFWDTSGLRVTAGADGLRVEVESARSLFVGAIAFRTSTESAEQLRVKADHTFHLYPNRAAAKVGLSEESFPYACYFQTAVNGLSMGSEVRMFGTRVGSVTNLGLVRDPRPKHDRRFAARVEFELEPEQALGERDHSAFDPTGMRALVEDQMRIVLRSSNLLTGEQVLSLEYVSDAPPTRMFREADRWVVPSEARDLSNLSQSLTGIAERLAAIPFQRIGERLDRTLLSVEQTVGSDELRDAIVSLDQTLDEVRNLARHADANLAPALARLPRISEKLERAVDRATAAFGRNGYGSDSTVQRNLERMMDEVAQAARSVRLLADYLTRHPEGVLRGRDGEKR